MGVPTSGDGGNSHEVRVALVEGVVAGVVDRGCVRFRGIPYAAPPFGANRFLPPQPVEPWEGVRSARDAGPGVPQPRFPEDPLNTYFNPPTQGEDCLNLDVWTPDPATSGLPVMVWIHGGGFMTGTGSAPAHDGYTFARDGIVHVGINYRLGIDGFTFFGDGTENRGLLDQIAALEWVQRNISRLGGDPGNVTIFGQSAGAVSVMDLLAMPAARGLFARAIAQSGAPNAAVAVDDALEVTNRLAARFGVPATREGFTAVPLERTVQEVLPMAMDFLNPQKWGARSFMISPYRAVYGTDSLPEPLLTAAPSSTVPLLTGTTRNESVGFLRSLGLLDMNPLMAWRILRYFGTDRSIRRAYRSSRGLRRGRDLVEAAWTDWAFRYPTIQLLEQRVAPSWLYEFRWESPSLPGGLGSDHALEVPFVRDDFVSALASGAGGVALLGDNPPRDLASFMHRVWTDFARTGDPGWAAYGQSSRPTMVFDTVSTVIDDPAGAERQAWKGKR